MERDPTEVLTRPSEPPDAVVRYADHADGVIDLFLPPTFGRGARTIDSTTPAEPPTPEGGARTTGTTAPAEPPTPEGAAQPAPAESRPLDRALERAVEAVTQAVPTDVGPCPLVVALHGGFWRGRWDRAHLRPLAAALVAHGFAVATPEYRRGAGSWPDTAFDVTRAIDSVADLVEAVAPGLIDPHAPFILTGHSAGGQLALWGGLRAGPRRVRRIVALAPVADLIAAARNRMGDGAVSDFLGGDPDERPAAYAQADPMRLLPGDVPVTIIQGGLDVDVPAAANRAVAHALSGAGTVTYVEVPDVEHFGLVDPLAPVFADTVLPHLHS